jgi:hypothetical protein
LGNTFQVVKTTKIEKHRFRYFYLLDYMYPQLRPKDK